MRKVFFACVFLLTIFLLSPGGGFGFRCGDELVSIGDSKAKVKIKCGPPTHMETASTRSKNKVTTTETGTRQKGKTKVGVSKSKSEKVEKWHYNCGDNDFIYVLTFTGGTISAEDTEGYGRGKSDCGGRKR